MSNKLIKKGPEKNEEQERLSKKTRMIATIIEIVVLVAAVCTGLALAGHFGG